MEAPSAYTSRDRTARQKRTFSTSSEDHTGSLTPRAIDLGFAAPSSRAKRVKRGARDIRGKTTSMAEPRGYRRESIDSLSNDVPSFSDPSTSHLIAELGALKESLTTLKTSLTCRICTKMLFEPYTTPCGHTYCYSCLCHWFQSTPQEKTCPDCRAAVHHQPAPAYLIKDLVQALTTQPHLLDPNESPKGMEELRLEEAEAVQKDRLDKSKGHGGLFRGMFTVKQARPRPLRDATDGVDRCPMCHWELEGGQCHHCGYQYHNENGTFSDDSLYDGQWFMQSNSSSVTSEHGNPEGLMTGTGAHLAFDSMSDREDHDWVDNEDDMDAWPGEHIGFHSPPTAESGVPNAFHNRGRTNTNASRRGQVGRDGAGRSGRVRHARPHRPGGEEGFIATRPIRGAVGRVREINRRLLERGGNASIAEINREIDRELGPRLPYEEIPDEDQPEHTEASEMSSDEERHLDVDTDTSSMADFIINDDRMNDMSDGMSEDSDRPSDVESDMDGASEVTYDTEFGSPPHGHRAFRRPVIPDDESDEGDEEEQERDDPESDDEPVVMNGTNRARRQHSESETFRGPVEIQWPPSPSQEYGSSDSDDQASTMHG